MQEYIWQLRTCGHGQVIRVMTQRFLFVTDALTPGLDFSSYPRAFTLSFGVNLGF